MTISRDDFLRTLPAAIGLGTDERSAIGIAKDEVFHRMPGRSWRITLTPLPTLLLGRLALPRHRVRILLAGYTEPEAQRFLERFELHFRRGGG
jgi:hypothetical protein